MAIQNGIYGKNSIDEFLEWYFANEAIVRYGKAAIVKCIIEAEAESLRACFGQGTTGFKLDIFKDKWFWKFFTMLMSGHSKSRLRDVFHNVQFVIFNYDRCVEFSLFKAFQTQGYTHQEALEFCSDQEIFLHPYGKLAGLFSQGGVEFGGGIGKPDCAALSMNIKTYSEQQGRGGVISSIHAAIEDAEQLAFLGFYYNEQNIHLLYPNGTMNIKRIFGTAFERSTQDIQTIMQDLGPFLWRNTSRPTEDDPSGFSDRIFLHDVKCASLFDAYSATLPRAVGRSLAAHADS